MEVPFDGVIAGAVAFLRSQGHASRTDGERKSVTPAIGVIAGVLERFGCC